MKPPPQGFERKAATFIGMPNCAKTGVAIAVAIASGTGLWSASALADDNPPANVAAIAQYVEAQPTLAGPRVVTPETAATTHVSPATAHAIARLGQADKAALAKNLSGSSPPVASTPAATRHAVATPHAIALGGVVQSSSTGLSYRNALAFGGLLVLISLACVAAVARRRTPRG
jgi:hypothetical protein